MKTQESLRPGKGISLPELGRPAGVGIPLPKPLVMAAVVLLIVSSGVAATLLPRIAAPSAVVVPGNLEAAHSSWAQADRTGVVEEVLVRAGDEVSQGQPLLSLRHLTDGVTDWTELVVVAPVAGVIQATDPDGIERLQGAVVAAGAPILEIADPTRWRVRFRVSAEIIGQVSLGDPVRVRVVPDERADGEMIEARVASIATRATVDSIGGAAFEVMADLAPTSELQSRLHTDLIARVELDWGGLPLPDAIRRWIR